MRQSLAGFPLSTTRRLYTNKGAVVEFFSAKDYLGPDPDPDGSPEPITSNSARN